ncbi:AfsR/SARP family transcriptional regulator [Gordonia otitidis]|uniref:Transcriptional regulator n=1 Tax=Gordonia otitidis (strain DSM 44809 / CCUG 52243 / JCM 12355 / NBRC 100426 / IFM 10032) TaxID=1108044 RepID=H5TPL9_GORO1|nr:AfsR/SARP family transcriptional regulator [Gordonia otitidis]GAB35427.1 putative transcriptional regulator [Gordonia otitidis NBRC 100426]
MREYLILGPLEVRCDGELLDLGSPKQRAVLGALVLARGAVVSVDRLIDAVWGPHPPPAATTSLQAYISNLRRALRGESGGPSPIERVSPGYRLNIADDSVDLVEYTALAREIRDHVDAARWRDAREGCERALALWRGQLLADMADEKWVGPDSVAATETRLAVTEAHITTLLAHGDTGQALTETVALRAIDPLRDRAAWLHMVALYRAGRGADALATYTDHVRRLDNELGLDPGRELRELQGAILRHDAEIAAWPRQPHWSGASPVSSPTRSSSLVSDLESPTTEALSEKSVSTLVGREAQMTTLTALFDDSSGPATRWLALSGVAGIGKTRLAEEAADVAARNGDDVVWVRCPDAQGIPAWWPMRQLCRDLKADAAAMLSVPPGVDADAARFAVYERVQALIESRASARPVTIIVDDAQWADPMSIDLLVYLTTALRNVAVRVILTIREEEVDAQLARLRGALVRAGGRVVDVPALTRHEVTALARQTSDDELSAAELDGLFDRTGGNPLFVAEYARLPNSQRREIIPAAVRSVLDRRLVSLDPTTREVLGHAAVISDEIDVTLLAAVMGRDVDEVADCIDDAVDERIVVAGVGHNRTVFAHALLREEAMAGIKTLRRCRIHLRTAEILATTTGADSTVRRAGHLLNALPLAEVSEVIAACRRVAADATSRWDSVNAAYWLDAALRTYESLASEVQDVTVRDDLLVDLLDAHLRAGNVATVLDTVAERLTDAMRSGSTQTAGRLAATLIRSGGGWPWVPPGVESGPLQEVLRTVGEFTDGDAASSARVLGALAIGSCYSRDANVPATLLARAEACAQRAGDVDVLADVMIARLITYSGVAERAAESVALGNSIRDMAHTLSAFDEVIVDSVLTMATTTLGDLDATQRHLRRGIVGSERMRLPILRAQLRWMEAALAVWYGEFDRAREHFDTAFAVHQQTQLYVAGSGALAMMAMATQEGMFEQFVDDVLGIDRDDRLEWVRTVVSGAAGNSVATLLASGVATVAGVHGDTELAIAMVDAWLADREPMMWTSLAQAVILSGVVVELDLADRAQILVDYLEPFAGAIATVGQVGCIGPVDLALAELHFLLGHEDAAIEALDRARQLSESAGSVPGVLRCRMAAASRAPAGPRRDRELADIAALATVANMTALASAATAARAR